MRKDLVILIPREEFKRYIKQYAPRGSDFLRVLEWDVVRFLSFLKEKNHNFRLIDEQTEEVHVKELVEKSQIFIYTSHTDAVRVFELLHAFKGYDTTPVLFGPFVSYFPTIFKEMGRVIVGDPVNVFEDMIRGEIKGDIIKSPKKCSEIRMIYSPDKDSLYNVNFGYTYGDLTCRCNEEGCTRKIYYNRCKERKIENVVEEIKNSNVKYMELLDEGIEKNPDYYEEIFKRLYGVHKTFKVTISGFVNRKLLKTMESGGVKVVVIKGFLTYHHLKNIIKSNTFRREVIHFIKRLHSHRFTVGLRLNFTLLKSNERENFVELLSAINSTGVDYIEVIPPLEYYKNIIKSDPVFAEEITRFSIKELKQMFEDMRNIDMITGTVWLKSRFYGLSKIWGRVINRIPALGFYNSLMFNLRYNMALRQNFLEGISFPP